MNYSKVILASALAILLQQGESPMFITTFSDRATLRLLRLCHQCCNTYHLGHTVLKLSGSASVHLDSNHPHHYCGLHSLHYDQYGR
jgi:hypothetical protein